MLLHRLRSGDLDLTFAVLPLLEADDLTVDVLCQDPFVALAPLDSKILPPEGPIEIRDFDGLPIIGQPRTSCQLVIEEGFRKAGVEPDVVFRSTDNGAVQAMVRAGMGHAVLARLAVDIDDPTVAIRPLAPPMDPRTIVLVRVTDRHLPRSELVLREPGGQAHRRHHRRLKAAGARPPPRRDGAPARGRWRLVQGANQVAVGHLHAVGPHDPGRRVAGSDDPPLVGDRSPGSASGRSSFVSTSSM